MSGGPRRPWGRVRERLAELLAEAGVVVHALAAAQGRERSDATFDIYRWEAHGVTRGMPGAPDGILCWVTSYDTMTDCVRRGLVLDRDEKSMWAFDAYAKTPRSCSGTGAAPAARESSVEQ